LVGLPAACLRSGLSLCNGKRKRRQFFALPFAALDLETINAHTAAFLANDEKIFID
jgi:hypothetical protein